MEEEVKCPACSRLYDNPVLLPCYHSLCLNCAVHLQQAAPQMQIQTQTQQAHHHAVDASCSSEENLVTAEDLVDPDPDKLSIVSETDSGVVCTSRPNSYVGTPNMGLLFPPLLQTSGDAVSLTCPQCRKVVYFDDHGSLNLPKNRALRNIVEKYADMKQLAVPVVKCQLCDAQDGGEEAFEASVMCEQCEVFYCETCRERCHPARGPLAKHTLLPAAQGRAALRKRGPSAPVAVMCTEHPDEALGMYCMECKAAACAICLEDGRHPGHDVQALSSICKAHKTELSQTLQSLSEKARAATDLIQSLKNVAERISICSLEVEEGVSAQVEALVVALRSRHAQLIEHIRREKEVKVRQVKEQVAASTCKLQQTTALLQFCIEALKETDPTAFLQIGTALINRVSNVDIAWHKEMTSLSLTTPDLELTLDDKPPLRAIHQLNFLQMKPPGAPCVIPEECSSENNSITIVWASQAATFVEGYVLELDDGSDGAFREVYCGKETMCTVDGLHFNSVYNARVKAFNTMGESEYSESVCLQTADVAWFSLDAATGHSDILLSNEQQSVTCDSYEHRVVLGNVGFSRGVHYWEFTVDRYDNNADPAFGIARFDVTKDSMLGKDDKGWSMYIDKQRSWFLHGDCHESRTEGGIQVGSVVGVLLDLDRRQLSFYVNQEPQGPSAFLGLHGVFYPALSLNRNVQVTIHTALDVPVLEPESD